MKSSLISAIFIVLLFAISHSSYSQLNERGAEVTSVSIESGSTKAIIIGISSYKELPLEKQLAYADKDAMAFIHFLQSRNDIDTIIHFLNHEANSNIVYKTIYKALLKNVTAGDQVIIYFAGHGDVDSELEDGFLLFHEVEEDTDYAISDAMQISDLQELITAAAQKGVQTLLITDACRSGKIVGDENGTKNTITALTKEWENTLKLVSCQPNQLSYEGEQWGGGHGAFTYHLLRGLAGLADEDENDFISFGEAYDYVKRKVKEDTENRQIPKLAGDETAVLFSKSEEGESNMLSYLAESSEAISYVSPRSLSGGGTKIPESQKENINEFEYLLKNNQLLRPENENTITSSIRVLQNPAFNKKSKTEQFDIFTIDPAEKLLAHSNSEFKIKLYRLSDSKVLRSFKGHFKRIVDMTFSNDGKYLASVGEDNLLLIFDVNSYRTVKHFEDIDNDPLQLAFSPDNNYLAVGTASGITFYNTSSWTKEESKSIKIADLSSLCFSNDANKLIIGSKSGELIIYDINTQTELKRLNNHNSEIKKLEFLPEINAFLSIDNKGKAILWKDDIYRIANEYQLNSDNYNNLEVLTGNSYENVIKKLNRKISNAVGESKAKSAIVSEQTIDIPAATYAYDLYTELIQSNDLIAYKDRISSSMINSLIRSVDKSIKDLTSVDLQPSVHEIREAIRKTELVLELYEDEVLLTKKVRIRKLYLEAYISILNHDFDNYDMAIEKINEIIALEPNASFTYNALSVLYRMKNELNKAEEFANKAIEKSKSWTEPKKNLGDAYVSKGSYEQAMEQYEKIIEVNPESSKGYSSAGALHLKLGTYSQADNSFKKSIKNDSLNPKVYLDYGQLEFARGNISVAEEMFQKGIILAPDNAEAHKKMGDLNYELYQTLKLDSNKLFAAVKAYKKAMELQPNDPELMTSLSNSYILAIKNNHINIITSGIVWKSKNEHLNKEILRLSNQAIKADPYHYEAYTALAFADKNKSGEMMYWEMIKKHPDSKEPYFEFAKFHESNGNKDKAIGFYNKAIGKDKQFLDAYLALWEIYSNENDLNQLKTLYSKTEVEFPESPIFHYKYALIKMKNKQEYDDDLKRAIEIDGSYSSAVITKQVMDSLQNDKLIYIDQNEGSAYYDYILVIRNMMSTNNLKLYNYIDVFGDIVIPEGFPKIDRGDYKNISNYRLAYDKLLIIKEKGYFGVTNYTGELVIPLLFDEISRLENDLFKVKNGNQFGIYDYRGEIRVPVQYIAIRKVEKAMMREYYQCELKDRFDYYNLYGEYQFDMKKNEFPNNNYNSPNSRKRR